MLKLITWLFGQRAQSLPEPETGPEVDSGLLDRQILNEYFSIPPEAKRALRAFVLHASAHLGEKESARLARRVVQSIEPGGSADAALVDGLVKRSGQQRGKWLLLHVDWKAVEEVSWQADELATALNIKPRWAGQEIARTTRVAELLHAFGVWLSEHQYALVHVDTDGDSYAALAMPADRVDKAFELARAAQLKADSNEDFWRGETGAGQGRR
jgi:hypothetical protein